MKWSEAKPDITIKKYSDICLHFKSKKNEYGPVEDCQLIVNHILAHWFQKKLIR